VRDCQSLLDQAISHGSGNVTADTVKAMLGLGDRAQLIDLFTQLMQGDIATALATVRAMYDAGADPQTLLADLCDFTHLVTRIKIVPAAADDVSLTPDERTRGAELAGKLAMRALTRTWQILFKGFEEVSKAGNALQAAEMVLIRLAHAADLPSPDELIAKLGNQPAPQAITTGPVARSISGGAQAMRLEAPRPAVAAQPVPQTTPQAFASPRSYLELVALAGEKRDVLVKVALESSVTPVSFADGRIEVALVPGADPGIIQTLSARLEAWTGKRWMVTVKTNATPAPTIKEQKAEATKQNEAEAQQDPLVQKILETFPGARVRVTIKEEQVPVEAYEELIPDEEDDQ
jgi:DNA polymerase-3 subunit gamma/tau